MISIHAPHEGERPQTAPQLQCVRRFQSTLPTRGSDRRPAGIARHIHYFNPRSPRGGATKMRISYTINTKYFNPRSPRGGATKPRNSFASTLRFQSTLPTRGSDGIHRYGNPTQVISIHAPHEGERPFFLFIGFTPLYFNPRSPRGGATIPLLSSVLLDKINFNPRSPRGGATCTARGHK